jgi:hypothetical protein
MISKQYVAGFVDGEGYVGLMKSKSPNCKLGYRYVPCIKIAQTEDHMYVLLLIKEMYGGCLDKPRKHKGNQRNSVMLSITNHIQVQNMINDIIKYSIVKNSQLYALKRFFEVGKINTRSKDKLSKTREEVYEKREKIYHAMRTMNRRGKAAAETE